MKTLPILLMLLTVPAMASGPGPHTWPLITGEEAAVPAEFPQTNQTLWLVNWENTNAAGEWLDLSVLGVSNTVRNFGLIPTNVPDAGVYFPSGLKYGRVRDAETLTFGDKFTISIWYAHNDGLFFFGKDLGTSPNREYSMTAVNTGSGHQPRLILNSQGGNDFLSCQADDDLLQDIRYNVTFVVDQTNTNAVDVGYFTNGLPADSTCNVTNYPGMINTPRRLFVGTWDPLNNLYKGFQYQICFWGTALTDQEVLDYVNCTKGNKLD